jgi:Domain of unknown function (DUF6089)
MRAVRESIRGVALVALMSVAACCRAQFAEVGASAGASNYLGDVGGKYAPKNNFQDMHMSQSRWSVGVYCRYRAGKSWSYSGSIGVTRVSDADRYTANPERRARNMNFRTDILELSAKGEWTLWYDNDVTNYGYYNPDMRTYVLFGVSAIMFNPKGSLPGGRVVDLRELETEGVRYGRWSAAIPVGIGTAFTFDKKWRVGLELSWRWCFTDRLDDISGAYAKPGSADAASFTQQTSQQLIDQINRENGTRLTLDSFRYVPGAKAQAPRGNPLNRDGFVTCSLTVGRVLSKEDAQEIRRRVRKTRARF